MIENINNPSIPSQVIAKVNFPKFISNLGIIPTSYKDSMSYYEILAWFCKYLEEVVVPTVNENGEAVEELQALYVELKDYVDTYFDSQDWQTMVNNKLDEMAENGTLTNLIKNYVDPIFATLQNQVNQELLEQNSTIEVLSGRMDEFTTLPSGSTSSDAELVDIRVGSDGTVYSNAGSSVRNQIDRSYQKAIGNNLYNKNSTNKLTGYYFSGNTGKRTVNVNFQADIFPFDRSISQKISFSESYVHICFSSNYFNISEIGDNIVIPRIYFRLYNYNKFTKC